jgi:ProQ/FINO family
MATPMNNYDRKFPREHLEESIRVLAELYPACFNVDTSNRRPLKKTIRADLAAAGVSNEIIACVNFYEQDWTYLRALQAGVERIDLFGKKAGVVTVSEQQMAQKKIKVDKDKIAANKASNDNGNSPVAVFREMYDAGEIPDDQLSKLTAPPRARILTPTLVPMPTPAPIPVPAIPAPAAPMARLESLLTAASGLNSVPDEALRKKLTVATLREIIQESETAINTIEQTT